MRLRSLSALAVTLLLCLIGAPLPLAGETEVVPVEIPNARWLEGRLLLGGQPTEAQLQRAAELGFRKIINMRGVGEKGSLPNEAEIVEALGMSYSAIPIASGADFSVENATMLAELLNGDDKAMIHCASGNRVGVLFALKSFKLDGLEREAAIELGERYGMRRLPSVVDEALAAKP